PRQAERRRARKPPELGGELRRFLQVHARCLRAPNLENQRFLDAQPPVAGEGIPSTCFRLASLRRPSVQHKRPPLVVMPALPSAGRWGHHCHLAFCQVLEPRASSHASKASLQIGKALNPTWRLGALGQPPGTLSPPAKSCRRALSAMIMTAPLSVRPRSAHGRRRY